MDVARSAPQGAHYHADVIYLLPYLGIKKGASALWYSELGLHQLGSRPTVFIPRWTNTPLHSISSVCQPWGSRRRQTSRQWNVIEAHKIGPVWGTLLLFR